MKVSNQDDGVTAIGSSPRSIEGEQSGLKLLASHEKSFEDMEAGLNAGNPYVPFIVEQRNGGMVQLCLPDTIYATMMLLWIGVLPWDSPYVEASFFYCILPQFVCFFLVVGAQISLMWYVYDVVVDGLDGKVCFQAGFCNFVGAVVFACVVLNDVMKSSDMLRWLAEIPSASDNVVKECKNWSPPSSTGCLKFRRVWASRGNVAPDGEEHLQHFLQRPAFGITCHTRVTAISFFILPKFIVEVCLLFTGIGYILYSESNEDAIANALALTFVAEIDDLAGQFFATRYLQIIVRSIPPIGLLFDGDEGEVRRRDFCWEAFGSCALLIFLGLAVSIANLIWCT